MDMTKEEYFYMLRQGDEQDPETQFEIGMCYLRGEGTQQDGRTAEQWLKMAADQGHPKAMEMLGRIREKDNKEITNDSDLLDRCAEAEDGDREAQYQVAMYFAKLDRPGVREDVERYLQMAEDQGHDKAGCELGKLLLDRDPSEAVRHLRNAADCGNLEAMHLLAECYMGGVGVEKDGDRAEQFRMSAAQRGDAEEKLKLALDYRYGRGVPTSLGKAMYWVRKAQLDGMEDALARFDGEEDRRIAEKQKQAKLKAEEEARLKAEEERKAREAKQKEDEELARRKVQSEADKLRVRKEQEEAQKKAELAKEKRRKAQSEADKKRAQAEKERIQREKEEAQKKAQLEAEQKKAELTRQQEELRQQQLFRQQEAIRKQNEQALLTAAREARVKWERAGRRAETARKEEMGTVAFLGDLVFKQGRKLVDFLMEDLPEKEPVPGKQGTWYMNYPKPQLDEKQKAEAERSKHILDQAEALRLPEPEKIIAHAGAGDPDAQFVLGFCLLNGCCGFPIDYPEGLDWCRKSADQGNANSQWLLGLFYTDDREGKADLVQAVRWLKKAAAQGHEKALRYLNYMWYDDSGRPVKLSVLQPCLGMANGRLMRYY